MDPITAAIVAAIAAGVTGAGGKVVERGLVDAYNGVKDLLKRKFSPESPVSQAVSELETNPDSKARAEVLGEEVVKVKAPEDLELLTAAKALLAQVEAQPGGASIVSSVYQSYVGNNGIVAGRDAHVKR